MQFPEPTLTQEFLAGFLEVWRLWVPLLLLLILGGVGDSALVGWKIAAVITCRPHCLCRQGDTKGTNKRAGDHGRLEQTACTSASNGED
jgi:hypothetical protein